MSVQRIHLLSAVVSNQIAAGEVIERPASVVKELLENALDAGATHISIEIGFGGLNQVKISDNGEGILAEDLPLAIAANATSKIAQLDDLYVVSSMGFRGEALASIASVSRLSVQSKPLLQEHAMQLQVENGAIRVSPCARNQGTTIDVRDLFFNAPVRKKFLKTERMEYQAIEAVVRRFALSAPSVAMRFCHNGKLMLSLSPATCEQSTLLRLKKTLGKTFVDQAVYLDETRAGMRLHGWVSGPAYLRSQQDKQWVYINRRMVKDKLINHAIKQAYASILHPGRYPACVLYLTIASGDVDVNVHPTKHEVRFQQPRLVHDFITTCITDTISVMPAEPIQPLIPLADRESNLPPVSTVWALAHPRTESSYARPWLILNQHNAVVFLDEAAPFLIDVSRVQQHKLAYALQHAPKPLASRPLLVPVSYAIDATSYRLIEQLAPLWSALGIQLDFSSEVRVMLRSIPKLIPLLDFGQVLRGLNSINGDEQALRRLVVDSQAFDAHQLTLEEKADISIYLQEHILSSSVLPSFCLRLDIAHCRDILHD